MTSSRLPTYLCLSGLCLGLAITGGVYSQLPSQGPVVLVVILGMMLSVLLSGAGYLAGHAWTDGQSSSPSAPVGHAPTYLPSGPARTRRTGSMTYGRSSAIADDDDVFVSAAIGAATNDAMIGGLLGGSFLGGVMGDIASDGVLGAARDRDCDVSHNARGSGSDDWRHDRASSPSYDSCDVRGGDDSGGSDGGDGGGDD